MKEKRRRLIIFIIAVALGLAALVTQSVYRSAVETGFRTRRFTRILHEKERIMASCLNDLKLIMSRGEPHGSAGENKIFTTASENDITILQYIDRKLIHWSDNKFDVPVLLQDDSLFARPLIFLQNGWFIPQTIVSGNERIIGLLRLRTDYSFENDIVRNGFGKDYGLSPDVQFSTRLSDDGNNVYNSKGDFLFSLVFPVSESNNHYILIPLILWAAFFLVIILLVTEGVKMLAASGKNSAGILTGFLIFSLIYMFILLVRQPSVISGTELFSPYVFSLNSFIPSLGHFMILSILAGVFAYIFYVYFPLSDTNSGEEFTSSIIFTSLFIAGAFIICMFHIIFGKLVSNSNINFETYKVLDLSLYSAAGYTSVIFFLLLPALFVAKAFRIAGRVTIRRIIIPVIVSLGLIAAILYREPLTMAALIFLWAGMIFIGWFSVARKPGKLSLSVLASLILGIYALVMITVYSEKKTNENLKIQALSFSTENDPEAEHLLLDMWPVLRSDTLLASMMDVELFERSDFNEISAYLNTTYFTGYWGNFNINFYLCRQGQLLKVGPGDDDFRDCYTFFGERIDKYGQLLTGTDFYFIDNQGARPYYIGRLFFNTSHNNTNGLFIELYGDINVFQPGYSELLLDKRFHGYADMKYYSFAKYINGSVVLNYGEFPYNKADDEYVDENTDYRIFVDEKFRHILYRNGNATVIISRPVLNAGNLIISFAYLFAFTFLFINLLLILFFQPSLKGILDLNFRQKLQLSFAAILLFSFILVGSVVSSLTVREFQSNHYQNIKEKLSSIYIELESEISNERHLTPNWRNSNYASLNELLINLSNIFNTDINLYDINGFLMATSRPELFFRDLASHRMDMMAFMNVADLTKSQYIQTESVGNMKYISAYVPFYNTERHVLAYLNLPYFRMQSLLTREISNLIVAIINFTLLIIVITMAFGVFISGRLTSPLSMLSEGMASVKLGKKSEHLTYKSSDEIGELVNQYNIMVDELEESAQKLANSEREYAWREMAKQIAHEIKNPLTPMKLNVQQLLKSWKDNISGFGEKIESFAKNQIEYIDNLSNIASAFSSFAKMPGTNPLEVDLLEQIKTTLELFRNADNITFEVSWPAERNVFIYADKEHLNGIFSNLLKNSIQAIPPERKGLIRVGLRVDRDHVTVSVSDNGTGIPEALKKRMFTPNFTTKSSGTGLGLSIVRKYVEGAGGRVWFESEPDRGTSFFVEFPLIYTVENPGEPFSDQP